MMFTKYRRCHTLLKLTNKSSGFIQNKHKFATISRSLSNSSHRRERSLNLLNDCVMIRKFSNRDKKTTSNISCPNCGNVTTEVPTTSPFSILKCEKCNKSFMVTDKIVYENIAEELMNNYRHSSQKNFNINIPVPKEIYDHLDKWVIGQKLTKKIISVQVYSHYKRLNVNWDLEKSISLEKMYDQHPALIDKSINNDDSINVKYSKSTKTKSETKTRKPKSDTDDGNNQIFLDKSNIILIGPTGSGKTLIAQVLAKYLEVPLVICDCTSLTQSGYIGEDVDSVVTKLFQAANYDEEKARKGIIFLDEIDKIASKTVIGGRDITGEGVQAELLKLLEGKTITLQTNGLMRKVFPNMGSGSVNIDTRDILFIASGAFGNIEEIIKTRIKHKNSLGFNDSEHAGSETINKDEWNEQDSWMKELNTKDLVKYGLLPEFIGRFPVIAPLHSLTEEMLLEILTKPQNALLKQYQELFELEKCKLTITDGGLKQIAKRAHESNSGARSLRTIIEEVLLDIRFELPKSNITEVTITEETVIGSKQPIIVRSK